MGTTNAGTAASLKLVRIWAPRSPGKVFEDWREASKHPVYLAPKSISMGTDAELTVQHREGSSDITIRADLARRTLTVSMALKARTDRKSTRARLNWLLGMLKTDDPRLRVQAYWPGRAAPTSESVSALREDPGRLQWDLYTKVTGGQSKLPISLNHTPFPQARSQLISAIACFVHFATEVIHLLDGWPHRGIWEYLLAPAISKSIPYLI